MAAGSRLTICTCSSPAALLAHIMCVTRFRNGNACCHRVAQVDAHDMRCCCTSGSMELQVAAEQPRSAHQICNSDARLKSLKRNWLEIGEGRRTGSAILLHRQLHGVAICCRVTKVDSHDLRYCCTGGFMESQLVAEWRRWTHMICDTVARAKS